MALASVFQTIPALWVMSGTLLLGCAAIARSDLIGRIRLEWITPDRELIVMRAFVFVAGVATCGLALSFPDRISNTLLFHFILMAGFTVAFVFAVYLPALCRRTSAIAALAAWPLRSSLGIFPNAPLRSAPDLG
jgi:Na+/proline symporter